MLLTIVLLIALAYYAFRLSARVDRLEEKVRTLQGTEQSPDVTPLYPTTSVNPNYGAGVPVSPTGLTPTLEGHGLATPNPFIEWVKQDFLVKLGALLLLIALGWFVSYAFANNWIGPAGRITIGLLVGVLFMVVGVWRIRTARHQGAIFTVLGATTVIFTMFAARELYAFFTPMSALLVMFMAVAFVTFVSLRYQLERLAVAGLALGLLSPLFTASPTPETLNLFLYLTVIVLGTVWVVFLTGWRLLTPLALLGVILWSAPYLGWYSGSDQDIALLFAFAFTALFFVTNVVSAVRRPDHSYLLVQVLTGLFTVLYLVTWIYQAVEPSLQSLLYTAWALVFAIGAYLVYVYTKNHQVFYIYGGAAVGLIGAATAAELSGVLLTIAFTLEIALFISVAAVLRAPTEIVRNIALLFTIPFLMSLASLGASEWRDSVLHGDAFVVVLMLLVALRVGVFLHQRANSDNEYSLVSIATAFYFLAGFYATALVWLTTHALFSDDLGTTVSLVVYTIVGLLLFVQGPRVGSALMRRVGMFFIGGVVARLLLVDIWEMPMEGRIITFFIIGVMLISTAFIGRRQSTQVNNENSYD